MTREEAIKMLKSKLDGNTDTSYEWAETVRMAIQALDQQPCEDCISREDLKRKLQEEHDLYVNAYGGFSNLPLKEKARVDEITSCIAEVVNMPSVYSQPKTGHWISVSERLPEESLNSVIGWDAYRERCVFVQYIDGHFQITGSDESFDIVAWMPLPEPYKAESEE